MVCENFSTSDHSSVCFSVLGGTDTSPTGTSESYDYNHADWERLDSALGCYDWSPVFSCTNGEDLWASLHGVLFSHIEQFVPKQVNRLFDKNKHKKRYPTKIKRLLSKKATAWNKFEKFKTIE